MPIPPSRGVVGYLSRFRGDRHGIPVCGYENFGPQIPPSPVPVPPLGKHFPNKAQILRRKRGTKGVIHSKLSTYVNLTSRSENCWYIIMGFSAGTNES
jgi:hypothetical protein